MQEVRLEHPYGPPWHFRTMNVHSYKGKEEWVQAFVNIINFP